MRVCKLSQFGFVQSIYISAWQFIYPTTHLLVPFYDLLVHPSVHPSIQRQSPLPCKYLYSFILCRTDYCENMTLTH